MAYIITRMRTNAITNVTHTLFDQLVDVRLRWSDNENVEVISDEEYEKLPKCPTCGNLVELRQCNECR